VPFDQRGEGGLGRLIVPGGEPFQELPVGEPHGRPGPEQSIDRPEDRALSS
jgi:hypothetical protein